MMKSRMGKTTKCFLVGAACMAFCTTTASADIVTFWKTDTCPDFGGQKVAIASEVGRMEAPWDSFAGSGKGEGKRRKLHASGRYAYY